MAAAPLLAPNHLDDLHRAPARPALRVLDGGRQAGQVVTPARRTVAVRSTPTISRAPATRRLPADVYWRRRVVVLAAAGLLVVVAWLALIGAASVLAGPAADAPPAGSAPAVSPAGAVHVVQPGDTLWSIAAELQPDGDVRGLVDRLANRAGGGALQVGQRIPLDGLVS